MYYSNVYIFISGYYFLRDARALPRMDTVLDSALRIPDIFSNFLTKFYVSTRCRKTKYFYVPI